MNLSNKQLRIFWNSNSIWSYSGYSQQMADLLPKMRDAGYSVAISNFYGQAGGHFMLDGIKQYPIINHSFGSDAMLHHARDFQADVVFTLQDVWPLNPVDLQQIPRFIPWTPIDHDPVPVGILQNLRFANRIISMSKFGQKQLANHGLSSTYIPHAVDTKTFFPMNTAERKQAVGIAPDTYIVGMVSANKDNPPRKSFQEVLDAYKLFIDKVPKSILYIHTDPTFPGGFPIIEYARYLGIEGRVIFPGVDLPGLYNMKYNTGKPEMNLIYNLFDVLLCPSTSEGFGIPIIEAQAVGCPVVVNNWCSMPELVIPGVTGEVCDYSCLKWSHLQSYTAIPSVVSLYEKMLNVYRFDRGKTRKAARKWIENNFALERIFTDFWSPFLTRLEQEIYGSAPLIDKPQPISNTNKAELLPA